MSTYKQQLEDKLADAELALAMADYAEALGTVSIHQYEESLPPDGEDPVKPDEAEQQFQMLMKRHKIKTEPAAKWSRFWRKALLRVAAVAAAMAIMFAALLLVQASGIDVFGKIGEWTDSTFRFQIGNHTVESLEHKESNAVKELHTILLDHGIPLEYAPNWLPPEYTITDVKLPEHGGIIDVVVTLYSDQNDRILYKLVPDLDEDRNTSMIVIEKDDGDPETYDVDGKCFYLFTNAGNAVATWSDNHTYILLTDSAGKEELIRILDSIGAE